MPEVVLFKHRLDDVSTDEFRRHMTEDRPVEIQQTPGMGRYRLWFPADPDDSPYDSVEVMSFDTESAMREAFESDAADRAHEAGLEYIDFENEESMIVEQALDLEVGN